MNSIKQLLMLSAKQRSLCKRLEAGRSRLYRMAYAWSHNSAVAEDVVQEAMIKALNRVDKVKNIEALDGWLFRILSNCFIDYCRKQRDEVKIDNAKMVEQKTPETVFSQNEMLAEVRSAIAILPFKHRQVLTLIDIENFSYAEVAEIVDAPLGTIMSRLNRARQSLKQTLNESSPGINNKIELKLVQ
ncbi:MAG: RNA polymerase sigma factor [Gammaproteobacteria bacterium]|nr:RNA polymerase sigma factor [Gammaproteobacteria bacterium]